MPAIPITVEQGIQTAGVGRFQYGLFLILPAAATACHSATPRRATA